MGLPCLELIWMRDKWGKISQAIREVGITGCHDVMEGGIILVILLELDLKNNIGIKIEIPEKIRNAKYILRGSIKVYNNNKNKRKTVKLATQKNITIQKVGKSEGDLFKNFK